MANSEPTTEAQETNPQLKGPAGGKRVTEWQRFRRVFLQRRLVVFGLVVLGILLILGVFAPFIAPYPPNQQNMPESFQSPNIHHWLGTDIQGRDTLSRLIYGSRTALEVGFGSVLLAGVIGISLGLIAGFLGGVIGMIIMRVMDALMGFPMILLALLISVVLGGGVLNVVFALSVATLPGYARVMNGLALSIRENDYVLAERSMGATSLRTMFLHVLPNGLPSMIVLVTLQLGALILAEAGLSYLGVGITPPTPAWGAMVADGQRYLATYP